MADLKDVRTEVTKSRIWFGFPHYVVLGWAAMVSWQIFNLGMRVDGFEASRASLVNQNRETLIHLTQAITELQQTTRELREDAVRTRTILELKFPRTAQRVEDAFGDEGPPAR